VAALVNLDSGREEWGEVVYSSDKEVAAAEVVHGQHDALEMAPPDHGGGEASAACQTGVMSCHNTDMR
jgi:hypothetical protein